MHLQRVPLSCHGSCPYIRQAVTTARRGGALFAAFLQEAITCKDLVQDLKTRLFKSLLSRYDPRTFSMSARLLWQRYHGKQQFAHRPPMAALTRPTSSQIGVAGSFRPVADYGPKSHCISYIKQSKVTNLGPLRISCLLLRVH